MKGDNPAALLEKVAASRLYEPLEKSLLYRVSQAVLAPGAERILTRHIAGVLAGLPAAKNILDVGCGPESWLWNVGLAPTGTDISVPYMATFARRGQAAIPASACDLPFADASFDAVWSFGLLHHLPEDLARQAVREMLRVHKPAGYVAVFDGVMPRHAWTRPFSWLIRKLDRGRFMRRQSQLEELFPAASGWTRRRFTYSYAGHEGMFFVYRGGGRA